MKYNKNKYDAVKDISTNLKDGRILFTKNSRTNFYLTDKKGHTIEVNINYYSKSLKLAI